MIVGSFLLVWSLGLPAQASAPSPAQAKPQPSRCAQALAGAVADAAAGEVCSGDEAARLANAAAKDGAEKTRQLEAAAEHYRKAALPTSNAPTKFLALNLLVDSYDAQRLNDPKRMEAALREVIQLTPNDLAPVCAACHGCTNRICRRSRRPPAAPPQPGSRASPTPRR